MNISSSQLSLTGCSTRHWPIERASTSMCLRLCLCPRRKLVGGETCLGHRKYNFCRPEGQSPRQLGPSCDASIALLRSLPMPKKDAPGSLVLSGRGPLATIQWHPQSAISRRVCRASRRDTRCGPSVPCHFLHETHTHTHLRPVLDSPNFLANRTAQVRCGRRLGGANAHANQAGCCTGLP